MLSVKQPVNFLLGFDIDAAGGVIEDDNSGIGTDSAGNQRLLLVAAGQAGNIVFDSGSLEFQLIVPILSQGSEALGAENAGRTDLLMTGDQSVVRNVPEGENSLIVAGRR